jgi:hypothetical protein
MVCITNMGSSLCEGTTNDGDVPPGATIDDALQSLGAMVARRAIEGRAG